MYVFMHVGNYVFIMCGLMCWFIHVHGYLCVYVCINLCMGVMHVMCDMHVLYVMYVM